ncbi:hypothetical protein [Bradyrhizobium sp. AS23.2]|uniref:hypothetical protein n=1 Tax=Bradyrhizobium sp. AS23.2 TaxID=1680155 RepID=UPI00095E8249|nr:hypothetical protein [Bradyrhizobium sp. AS23.2]OKO70491.1 hypothetical protein AC630_34880 [Bradyrhizobium sp. AS23.2]
MKDQDGRYVPFPLIDGALLWQNPARVVQMASELVRLDATRTEADAMTALVDHGSFSSIEIAMLVADALAKARALVTGAASADKLQSTQAART